MTGFYSTSVIALPPTLLCETCGTRLDIAEAPPAPPDFLIVATCTSCRKQYQVAAPRIPVVTVEALAEPSASPGELLDTAATQA